MSFATTSFKALASRRRSLTSSEVAARAVSPPGASCQPPEIPSTSDNKVLDNAFAAAQLSDAVPAAQTRQHDADLFSA